jgi:hypothetical protein
VIAASALGRNLSDHNARSSATRLSRGSQTVSGEYCHLSTLPFGCPLPRSRTGPERTPIAAGQGISLRRCRVNTAPVTGGEMTYVVHPRGSVAGMTGRDRRNRRAGHRRPEERRPCTFAFRPVCVQRRVACSGRDRVQPHPRRRDHRVSIPRQSHHRDDSPAADRSPRPPRQVRAAASHPPTKGLAWPWQDSWEGLFDATCGPPTPATT